MGQTAGGERVTFEVALAGHAASFFSLFGPKTKRQWAERLAAAAQGVPERNLRALYCLTYADLDARATAALRLYPQLLATLDGLRASVNFLAAFDEGAHRDALAASGLRFAEGAPRTHLEVWARADRTAGGYDKQRNAVAFERLLARLSWAFQHPERFESGQQRHLLLFLRELSYGLPAALAQAVATTNLAVLTQNAARRGASDAETFEVEPYRLHEAHVPKTWA